MTAVERLRPLLRGPAAAAAPGDGDLLDLLGAAEARSTGRVPDLMRSRALPQIYERWWRPAWSRLLLAPLGGIAGERRLAGELLALGPGERVLDVACGPGNFTRGFRDAVGPDGLAVGLDASRTMLERAVRDTPGGGIAWVRADATALPFADGAFDAVCCFAALHLMDDTDAALDELARVLAPGGRLAVLASVRRGGGWPAGLLGVRLFGPDELTDRLRGHGLQVSRRLAGAAQVVGARRP